MFAGQSLDEGLFYFKPIALEEQNTITLEWHGFHSKKNVAQISTSNVTKFILKRLLIFSRNILKYF